MIHIDVYMTDTRDGQDYIFQDNYDWQATGESRSEVYQHIRYMWTEGNYACDCNRYLFLDLEEPEGFVSGRCLVIPVIRLDKIVERETGKVIWPEPEDKYPGRQLGNYISLDGHTRITHSEEEYQQALATTRLERGLLSAVLNEPAANGLLALSDNENEEKE